MRDLRVVAYEPRPSLPEDLALLASVVRLAMRDAQRGCGEASDFLATFLDGVRPDLVAAYHAGAIDVGSITPWQRPELKPEKGFR